VLSLSCATGRREHTDSPAGQSFPHIDGFVGPQRELLSVQLRQSQYRRVSGQICVNICLAAQPRIFRAGQPAVRGRLQADFGGVRK
jgi:hypothetical protein